jgi:arylsulfatase A-like enzyme
MASWASRTSAGAMGANEVTLPMYLNRAGYQTRLIAISMRTLRRRCWATRRSRAPRMTRWRSPPRSMTSCRETRRTGRPFYVNCGIAEPHRPYEREGYDRDDPETLETLPYLPDRPGIREDLAGLHGLIWRLDEAVGRMRESLEASGLAEETLFIFTTDHGIAMPRAKGTCYDPGIMTTLIARWPARFEGGRVQDELLTNCDLLPTILDVVGVDVPAQVDGRSFLALLDGDEATSRVRTSSVR